MMTNEELIVNVNNVLEYKDMIAQLNKEMEAIEESIKQALLDRGVDELAVGTHVVRHKDVVSNRFDTKRFKADFGASAYAEYCKEVISKRFSIA